jgi:hypothetical protein
MTEARVKCPRHPAPDSSLINKDDIVCGAQANIMISILVACGLDGAINGWFGEQENQVRDERIKRHARA